MQSAKQQQLQQTQRKMDALPKYSMPIPPAMQASEFLRALADLNNTAPEDLQDFLDATQARSSAYLPKPTPIGTHDGVQYFIKSSDETIHQDTTSATISPARTSDIFDDISIYKAKSVSGGQSTTTDPDFGSPAESGDDIYGISTSKTKNIPISQSITTDFHYGFDLRRLYHKSSSTATHIEDTGFHVLCNAIDKSI